MYCRDKHETTVSVLLCVCYKVLFYISIKLINYVQVFYWECYSILKYIEKSDAFSNGSFADFFSEMEFSYYNSLCIKYIKN